MRGYDCEGKPQRPAPKIRSIESKEKKSRKRKHSGSGDEVPTKNVPLVEDESLSGETIDFEYPASADTDAVCKIEVATQTEYKSPEKEKREYFINQATCTKNCYRYTGVTRSKLDLLFEFIEPKATDIRLWRGSKNTKKSSKKRATPKKTNNDGVLTKWEQFVLTLVRKKRFPSEIPS